MKIDNATFAKRAPNFVTGSSQAISSSSASSDPTMICRLATERVRTFANNGLLPHNARESIEAKRRNRRRFGLRSLTRCKCAASVALNSGKTRGSPKVRGLMTCKGRECDKSSISAVDGIWSRTGVTRSTPVACNDATLLTVTTCDMKNRGNRMTIELSGRAWLAGGSNWRRRMETGNSKSHWSSELDGHRIGSGFRTRRLLALRGVPACKAERLPLKKPR